MNQAYVTFIISISAFTIVRMSPFLKPIERAENIVSFVRQDIEYKIINIDVTWYEAKIICESHSNGSLAILNTKKKASFVAEALSVCDMNLEDLWIGATKGIVVYDNNETSDVFIWLNNGGVYDPQSDDRFIKRGTESINPLRRCLAYARKYHEYPHFINLECNLKRAFICQLPYESQPDGHPTTPDWIVVGNYMFRIFYAKRTWKQSVHECIRKHSAQLATFHNMTEVTMVSRYMLIGRPSLENAWIGGHYKSKHWVFVDKKLVIAETSDESGFPPWRKNNPIKHSGCLLLDRHMSNRTIFLEDRCERRKSYICYKEVKRNDNVVIIIINNMAYIVYYRKLPWEDARNQCKTVNAWLVKVTKENIHDVMYCMGENDTEINHIWIGGKLSSNSTVFYWIKDNEPISPNNDDIRRYPPWYDNIYEQQYGCLNLDRENHNRPIFYGASCEVSQPFICEQPNLDDLKFVAADNQRTFRRAVLSIDPI